MVIFKHVNEKHGIMKDIQKGNTITVSTRDFKTGN